MSTTPARVEIMSPVDRWLHVGAAVGAIGALLTGPLLERRAFAEQVGFAPGQLAALHGVAAFLVALVWALHLARVCLAWLEGQNPTALLLRPGDLLELGRGVAYGLRLSARAPRWGRFNYRERVSYTAFLLLLPLLTLSGWLVAHVEISVRLGTALLMGAVVCHSALGLLLALVLLWHLYFALLQPGALFWNGAWLNGYAPWIRVVRTRPDWAREIAAGLAAIETSEEAAPSVESLLEMGNEAARGGHYEQAVAAYEEALELYPGYSQALFNLGVARMRAGDPTGAQEALEGFLEQDPFSSVAPKAKDLLRRIGAGEE